MEIKMSLNCLVLSTNSIVTINISQNNYDNITIKKFIRLGQQNFPLNKFTNALLRDYICEMKNVDNFDDMKLWKTNDVNMSNIEDQNISTEDDVKDKLNGKEMEPTKLFRKYFEGEFNRADNQDDDDENDESAENIHVIATINPATDPGRKRLITEKETTGIDKRIKRIWMTISTIQSEIRNIVYFVDLEETNAPLLDMILKGEFVALYGARASGKSTRVVQAMEQLKIKDIVCIYITLEHFDMETVSKFWSALGVALQLDSPKYFNEDDVVKSADDFMLKFQKRKWNNRVVIFIDEYDALLEANDDIKSSFLGTVRAIKSSKKNYAILSMVAIGPFSILHLESDKITMSPFNVKEPFRNPNFTMQQVNTVYKEFEDDYKLTIDPEIIEDIYKRTDGHAGLVCLCGNAIESNLMLKLDENRRLSFLTWLGFVINSMQEIIVDNATFRKLISTLIKDKYRPALDLLRSTFIGSFDFKPIYEFENRRKVEFLTAEGVLIRDEESKNRFKISSIFIDELIRQRVIPQVFKSAPTVAVPEKRDHSLDILSILLTAIQFFDKDIIREAFHRSFKVARDMFVNNVKNSHVPRESVYDAELSRILVNWIVKQRNFEVTGQWHMVENRNGEKDKHTYSDIVITTDHQKIVLELLATATKKNLNEHFERVLEYATKLSANDIWIVHYTCEDDYTTQKLHWPPNDRKFESVNVVHFLHDKKFESVQMSARCVGDGTIKYIDQVIPLKS